MSSVTICQHFNELAGAMLADSHYTLVRVVGMSVQYVTLSPTFFLWVWGGSGGGGGVGLSLIRSLRD